MDRQDAPKNDSQGWVPFLPFRTSQNDGEFGQQQEIARLLVQGNCKVSMGLLGVCFCPRKKWAVFNVSKPEREICWESPQDPSDIYSDGQVSRIIQCQASGGNRILQHRGSFLQKEPDFGSVLAAWTPSEPIYYLT